MVTARKVLSVAMTFALAMAILITGSGGAAAAAGSPAAPEFQAGGPHQPESPNANTNAGTNFTYQGSLRASGAPYTGLCDFRFRFYDAETGGSYDSTNVRLNVQVTKGLFTTELEYYFGGAQRWLEIGVSCPHSVSPSYTTLTPRQKITGAPYAIGLMPGAGSSYYSSTGASRTHMEVAQESSAIVVDAYAAGTLGIDSWAWESGGKAVYGRALKSDGYGGYFENTASTGEGGPAVVGLSFGASTAATHPGGAYYRAGGEFAGANGLIGAGTGTASSFGVIGLADGAYGSGVYGASQSTSGTNHGVYGSAASTNGYGGYFYNSSGSGSNRGVAVAGFSGSGSSAWVHPGGEYLKAAGEFAGPTGILAAATTDSTGGDAVHGLANSGDGTWAIRGTKSGGGNYAGYFSGNVGVSGNFSAGGFKSFRIDDPRDPENKYLYHYAMESPSVQNNYNGTVVLDAHGGAVVQLPDYFSLINTGEFSYQLTTIGAAMPNLYVAEEIRDNTFKIAGGVAGKKVSWMVIAQRNDAWMRDHPATDVVDKPADEQGSYVYPAGFGRSANSSLEAHHDQQSSGGTTAGTPEPEPPAGQGQGQ